ncbi:SEC14 cytosolic factor, partial [Tetrabaena socialis]
AARSAVVGHKRPLPQGRNLEGGGRCAAGGPGALEANERARGGWGREMQAARLAAVVHTGFVPQGLSLEGVAATQRAYERARGGWGREVQAARLAAVGHKGPLPQGLSMDEAVVAQQEGPEAHERARRHIPEEARKRRSEAARTRKAGKPAAGPTRTSPNATAREVPAEERKRRSEGAQSPWPVITRNVILDLKGASLKTFSAAAQKILRTIAIIDQHYPHFYHKRDRYGRPVYIELLGASDSAKILEATSLERLLDYHVVEWERLQRHILPACSVLAGGAAEGPAAHTEAGREAGSGAAVEALLRAPPPPPPRQDYYCECLGQMFILNTPAIFRLAWAVVNPLLEERTRRKIVILGADYLPTLTQLIPAENLPTCLGGTSPIPDTKTSIGPWTEVELPAPAPQGAAAAATEPGAAMEPGGAAAAKKLAGGDAALAADQLEAAVAVTAVA